MDSSLLASHQDSDLSNLHIHSLPSDRVHSNLCSVASHSDFGIPLRNIIFGAKHDSNASYGPVVLLLKPPAAHQFHELLDVRYGLQ